MSDILDEIKEDLKYERYAYLWKKYGTYCIIVAVAAVLGTATGVWYMQHKATVSAIEGSKLFQALQYKNASKTEEADALYKEVIKGKSKNIASLAALSQAMTLAKAGKIEEAKPLFLDAAANTAYPEEFRQLSELMYVYFSLSQIKDNTKSDDIITRLEKLSEKGKIWQYNAKELLGFYFLQLGDKEKAKNAFDALKNDLETPVTIRQRAQEILEVVG